MSSIPRTQELLRSHPELSKLVGPMPWTFLIGMVLVLGQFALAFAVKGAPLWAVLAVSWCVGAFIQHALWVTIHEATHGLIFRSKRANLLSILVFNLPGVIPGAISFSKYHLFHHRHQGDPARDADLPTPIETAWVGSSPWRKLGWLATYPIWLGVLRPLRLRLVSLSDRWTLLNILLTTSATLAVLALAGPKALGYLFLSFWFSVGPHLLAARSIQEHFEFERGQKTYSYYGPLNSLMLNVGFHQEHHDIMGVAWNRLPLIREGAPEFYQGLSSHKSYTRLLSRFFFDEAVSL